MLTEKKYFGNGRGNFDDVDFVLQSNEWVNLENMRVGSTDKGVIGTVESVGSNVLLSSIQPSVTFVQIGSVEDQERNQIIYFLKDLYGPWDKIAMYDVATNTFYTVLLASQVNGGLNFGKNKLIHSARIVHGLLYWTDNLNQPRKINIDAAIKMNDPSYVTDATPYINPIDWREITIIKPPPPLAPNITKDTDSGFNNNFIANESFRFVFQYIYNDNETTVVGTYSNASRLNHVTSTFNRIIVSMDPLERIPQTVQIINLIVLIGTTDFIIKTWDRSITSEATEINNQNSGSTQLTYNFYNNATGPVLSSDLVLKPFDSVPIYSAALEVARNRLFLGNNVAGYDAPTSTSLSFTLNTVTLTGTSVSINLEEIWLNDANFAATQRYTGYYAYLTMVSPVGYYALTATEQYCSGCFSFPPFPPAPSSFTIGDCTYRGATTADVLASVNAAHSASMNYIQRYDSIYFATLTGVSVATYDIFKTRSQYKLGVVFYDFAMRKCGVITPPFNTSVADPTLVTIPVRTFAMGTAINAINWTLSNTNALTEIPDWAYYYTVVRTLNLRTRYFIQAVQPASTAKYATKDTDGNYVFTNNTFVAGAVGIGLDTTSLTQAGLGYAFTQGDVCILIKEDNTIYTLAVIDQSGKYIIVNTPEGGIGDLTGFKIIYEIYTPYQASSQEPYYEMGEMYMVANPGTSARAYNSTSGTLLPDAYALTRNFNSITYFAETMSPNDRFYSRWDNDAGKINYILKQGQVSKPDFIIFSNVYIPGTATNGLSTFEALNEKPVPLENGPIQKLQLTSKTQDEGTVMLAICNNETASIYLGETRILDNTGTTQFIASSSDVIGTINNLKGSFGTINPESVTEFRGNVYWLDMLNGKFIQYSLNGLFPISNYKMTRYWKLFCEQFLSMTQSQIEALGSRPFVFTTVDPHHWELLVTVPKLLNTPPMGFLPDPPYTSYVYPFDIWDGQAKTLVYKINAEPNFWQGSYSYTQEGYITIQNILYSFKFGQLYRHNDTSSYCNFNGVQYKSRLMFICNQQPERDKVYDNAAVEVNMRPTLTYFMSLSPYTQVSNLQDFDWQQKESAMYSQIYRNVLTPTATGLKPNALVTGEKMRTYALRVMLEFTVSSFPVELRFVSLGYQLSLGHSIPIQ